MYTDSRGHDLEYGWLGDESAAASLVFLHEGLGSIELWRDFPREVVTGTERRGLVYSRYGHGNSEALEGSRSTRFMHEEAHESLPGLIDDLVGHSPVLIGHSDGASIALLYAGAGYPVEGLVLIAPHVMVEERGLEAIRRIARDFEDGELPNRMQKYHREPQATFRGWADVWLSEDFRAWDISENLAAVDAPVLLIQSEDDAYGTLVHLDIIESGVAGPTSRFVVPGSSHSPHLTSQDEVCAATVDFIRSLP